jgi:hypothetical protein
LMGWDGMTRTEKEEVKRRDSSTNTNIHGHLQP